MKKYLKISLFFVSILLVIFIGLIIFITTTGTRPAFVHLPSVIPTDLKMQKVYVEYASGGYGIGYTYSNFGEVILTYIVEDANSFQCEPPVPNDTTARDYSTFNPVGSDKGCVVTVNKNGTVGRVYRWKSGLNKFGIVSNDLSILDEEILKIANSVKPKIILVQKQPVKLQDGSTAYPIKD